MVVVAVPLPPLPVVIVPLLPPMIADDRGVVVWMVTEPLGAELVVMTSAEDRGATAPELMAGGAEPLATATVSLLWASERAAREASGRKVLTRIFAFGVILLGSQHCI